MVYNKKIKMVGKEKTPYASKDNPYKSNNKNTTTVPNTEYAYHKGMSFAKEKEEKEILCPEVV